LFFFFCFFVRLIDFFLFCSPCCAKQTHKVFQRAREYVTKAEESAKALKESRDAAERANEKLRQIIVGLRRDLEEEKRKASALRDELAVYAQKGFAAGEHGLLSKFLLSLVFWRTSNNYVFPVSLQQVASTCQQKWNVLYPTHNLTSTECGGFVYGEPTFMTMTRICHVIKSELGRQQKPLQPSDIFLDWGCGAGKWLCFAQHLLGVSRLVLLGIEVEQVMFEICKKNIFDIRHASILHAQSQTLSNFSPARIVVNYDGGPQAMQNTVKGRIHQTIMRTAFCSPTVDVVVSTRLNWDAFWTYFTDHWHLLGGSLWKCIYIRNCGFGGSRFTANVWFRLTPMRQNTYTIDKQMKKLLTGFLFCSSEETYLL
jgi:hypothetical protein